MLVAIGMPALIGGAGFGVDTAQWYMWKRELQHSVDQAAYAGALALAHEDSKDYFETRAKQEYEANLDKVKGFASEVPSISIANYAAGTNNSVIVRATATKSLPFSSFLTGSAVTIRATAQASFAPGGTYQACLVALAENGTSLDIGGNATVSAKCGLAALSCSDDAVVIDSSAIVDTDSIVTCGKATVPEENEGVVTEGATGLKDIYADLDPPTDDRQRTYNCAGQGGNRQASLQAGTYSSLIVSCTTVLNQGIYVIDGGLLDLSANYNVTGLGVVFVLKNGARLKLGGNGNNNRISLSPPGASFYEGTIYAEDANRLADILIFEDRNSSPPEPGHQLNGNSNSLIEGLMYFPNGTLTVNGTANVTAQCLQISAYKIKVLGNAKLETLCPPDSTTSVGSSVASVRLVA
ncbi:pilus assembly protein TadG-related protein [Allopontixanthobacter sp.]|uniref:pilus assembly protein TadG-related protein n=1 Tax=Allopontixanthobacter sp. TaxID=2906452 RepID=UPI002ABA9272|nr:pilus assembly protein TadG-related protein [Allopontixanthobacter sp.]MDZ4306458.1 pilus assembly protein TadG-related protein [Allopontixanthobacter sp.]